MSYGEGRGATYTYDLLDRVVTASAGMKSVVNSYSYFEGLSGSGSGEGTGSQVNETGSSGDDDSSEIKYSFEYDSVGNMLSYTDGNGNSNTYTYDLLSNLTFRTNGLGDTESYDYDENNNLSQVTRPNGKTIKYNYNKLDALLGKEYSDENDGVVLYAYDIDGRRLTMDDLTGESVYEYDEDNRLTGVQQGDGTIIKYSYDEFGNLEELTYPDGKKVTYTYDALDRLVGVTDRDGKNTTYKYDSGGNMTEVKRANGTSAVIDYDPSGQVTDVKNLDASGKDISEYKYTYDLSGFVLTEEVLVGGTSETSSYTYDSSGQLTGSITVDKDGNTVEEAFYAYDAAGNRISSVINKSTVKEAIEKKEIALTYNAANQLTVMKDSEEGNTEYIYDENGNRIRATKAGESVLDYAYDTENRLTAITDKDGLLMTALYDGDDNRVFLASRKEDEKEYKVYIEKEDPSKSSQESNSGNSGQTQAKIKSAKTFEMGKLGNLFWYGFAGNMLQAVSTAKENVGKFWVDTWTDLVSAYHRKILKDRADKEGIIANPKGITGTPGEDDVTYKSEYEGTKTLVPYTTKKEKYYYYEMRNFVNDINQTNAQVLTAYDENGEQEEAYSYGNGRLDYNDGSDTYYYVYTRKGTVAQLMSASGSSITTYRADDFGNVTVSGNTETGNPYDYNAERTDMSGYQYLRARYYDPTSGNFLTEDSYAGSILDPMTLNLYAYVENNPINYADPSGHGIVDTFINIGKTVYGLGTAAYNIGMAMLGGGKSLVDYAAKRIIGGGMDNTIGILGGVVNTIFNPNITDTYSLAKKRVKEYIQNPWRLVDDILSPITKGSRVYSATSAIFELTKRIFCTTASKVKNVSVEFAKDIDWKQIANSQNVILDIGSSNSTGWQNNNYDYTMSNGWVIQFHEGEATQPSWEVGINYDNWYPYDPDAKATLSDYWNWLKWGVLDAGAYVLNYLPDGVNTYDHYRTGKGTPLEIDYNKAYEQDEGVRKSVDYYVSETNKAIAKMISEGKEPSFSITSEFGSNIMYPTTENWQKAIGDHNMWISADVTTDDNNSIIVTTTVHELDRYNFNKDEADIATGTKDEINGRFESLGWAHSFDTYGSVSFKTKLGDNGEVGVPEQPKKITRSAPYIR